MFRRSTMVRSTLAVLVLALAPGVSGAVAAGTDAGTVNFTLGYKNLTGDWNLDPRDLDASGNALPAGRANEPAMGLEVSWGRSGWPAQVDFNVLHSYDDGITHIPQFFTTPAFDLRLRARTIELGLGLRRSIEVIGLTPYLGAGGLWLHGSFAVDIIDPNAGQFGAQTNSGTVHASAFGYWGEAGIVRRIGPRFHLGAGYRYSKATLPERDFLVTSGALPFNIHTFPKADGGGRTIQLVAGWSFPGR